MAKIVAFFVLGIVMIVLAQMPGNAAWLTIYAAVCGGSFIGYALCLWTARRRNQR